MSLHPRPEEFDGVSLDERDIEELGRCRIGACDLRLPAEAIRQMGREIDWSMEPVGASARFRSFLHSRASAYRTDGHAALTPYSDRSDGNQPGPGLELLLGRPIPGLDAAPEIRAYLRDGRRPRPSGIVDEYLAWFRERFFRKSVVSLEHVVVARRDTPDEERVLVIAKKIYASHYLEASVEALEFARPRGALEGRLVVAARSRTDIRRSGFNWIERLLLRRTVRGRIITELGETRRRIESKSGSLLRADGGRISSGQ